ncbi:Disulfide bond formation protein B [Vibrio chagasii]|nr:Disulfide bond formation protein B [Vibrio chagasii]
MKIYKHLLKFSHSWVSWALMLVVVNCLLTSSMYFQHVVGLSPCINCIYERMCLIGLALTALAGLALHKSVYFRGLVMFSWLLNSGVGLKIATEHHLLQVSPSPFSMCTTKLAFSDKVPLDVWMPSVFKAFGSCSDSVWSFMEVSMVQWIIVIFGVSAIMALIFTLVDLIAMFRHEGVYIDQSWKDGGED